MGGKHKQANRTKNNARPSSSSHSAELLGNTIPTFFGFSSVKDGISSVSGFPSEESNYSIHPDFRIMFKQMNKKDPITRFKALQMFTDLCNQLDTDAVTAMLPLWPRMYCMLCTDVDHKVREVAHKAHHAVVAKVKKQIAPYLKELAGPWFTSQYDTYVPAASAATLAFQEAFPSAKLNKAIVFCQEEILNYIYDNLINQTPQTLSNSNTISAEDLQAKYERIIISSLQGYILYLQKLSSDQLKEATEINKKLISHQKFWKYSKNKVPLIRSCFFNTLIALCQNAKFLLKGESSHLSTAVFNNLDESDPIVLHTVWDAALNILVTIEDCWTYINIEKQLFTKLCSILKGGGRNISTIYPNILPLLSKLPEDMIKDKTAFYGNLFDNMRCGLEASTYSNTSTSSEGKITATTFIECLKYIIMHNASSDVQFCTSLVSNQLMPALEQKLSTNKGRKCVTTPFLIETVFLVHYWFLNRETENSTYHDLVKVFFDSLLLIYKNQVNAEVTRDALTDILNSQMEFLNILAQPNQLKPKNKGRVRFEEDAEPEIIESVKPEINDPEFLEEMLPFVKNVVVIYFKNAIDFEEKIYIPPITKIVNLFDPKVIFEEMVMAVNESTCFKLFSSFFSKWLMNQEMKCEELVDLSFKLLKYVTYDEKEYILEEFCNNWFCDTLQLSICKALPYYSEDDSIIKWVRSDQFAKSIINLAERYVNGDGDEVSSREIIVMLLKAKSSTDEFIIDPKTASSIIDVVSKSLRLSEVKPHIIELSQNLISNMKTEQFSQLSFEELVAALFKLSCYKSENEALGKACETGLRLIVAFRRKQNLGLEFTKKLSEAVREVIFSDTLPFMLDQIMLNINSYVDLVVNTNLKYSCSSNLELEKAMEIIKIFLEKENDSSIESGMKMIEKCCWVGYEGNDDLDFEYLQQSNNSTANDHLAWETYPSFDLNLVKKYSKWNLYVGSVLNLITAGHPRSYKTSVFTKGMRVYDVTDDENLIPQENYNGDIILMKITKEEESQMKNDLNVIEQVFHEPEYDEENNITSLVERFCDFLICVGLVELFQKYYTSIKYYQKLKEDAKNLKNIACDLLKNVNIVEFQFIYDHCKVHIRGNSIWWLVNSTLREVFHRRFVEFSEEKNIQDSEYNPMETSFNEFQKMDIASEPKNRGNYLKILGFVDKGCGHRISEEQWERVFICIHNFVEGFLSAPEILDSDLLTISSVARLFLKLMKTFSENHTKPNEERIHPETCRAWNEVVQDEIYNKFLLGWRKLAKEWYNKEDISPDRIIVLQNISDVVIHGIVLRKFKSLNESVEMAAECGRCLTSPHAVIQITSFRLCISVIPDLVRLDTETFGNNISQMIQDTKEGSSLFNKSANCEWTAKNLEHELIHNQGIVEILLSDFNIGDCCTVEPFTDSFTYTYAYLLMWCFLLDMCGEAHSPLRYQYGCWLQEAGYCTTLLESVFKLMPQAVLHGLEAKENCQKYFENYGSLDFRESIESSRIEQIACFVYRLFLQRLPNIFRDWWNQRENKMSSLVEKVTRLYISPILISNELKSVQQDRETGFDNMEVKTYIGSREVIATYTIDEVKMDLIITLAQNHPLGTMKIESSNVVVKTSNWRNWLFHICKYLIHQNGTIWDALVIWKNNLDKKFEGVEQCYICFFILHGSTFEIPRMSCRTCKKKFHSNCLFKWFNTSNKSMCPICRNLF